MKARTHIDMVQALKRLNYPAREGEKGILMAMEGHWGGRRIQFDSPFPVVVFSELDDGYYGSLIGDHETFNVRFPREATRELTESEVRKLRKFAPAFREFAKAA